MILILNNEDLSSYSNNFPLDIKAKLKSKHYLSYINKRVMLYSYLKSINYPLEPLCYSSNGKPFINSFDISFADSNSLEAIALSSKTKHSHMGIDLELVKKRNSIGSMLEKLYSPQEIAFIKQSINYEDVFYRFFSLREALVKCFDYKLLLKEAFKIMAHEHKILVDRSLYQALDPILCAYSYLFEYEHKRYSLAAVTLEHEELEIYKVSLKAQEIVFERIKLHVLENTMQFKLQAF